MAIQLAHAGRKSICKETTPVAPSAMAYSQTNGFKLPHALSLYEITQIKTQFVQAGLRAARAGYDMLELHAAHGYLLCEFLSPLTNTRDDAYGGSLENRCALTLEIAHLLIQTTGLPLCVRISADEWVEGGWDIAQSIYLASKLKEHALHSSMSPLVETKRNKSCLLLHHFIKQGMQKPFAKRSM